MVSKSFVIKKLIREKVLRKEGFAVESNRSKLGPLFVGYDIGHFCNVLGRR